MKSVGRNKTITWSGFTLVEAVFALVIVSLVVLSFNSLFRMQDKLNGSGQLDSSIEWHLFLSQLENTSSAWEYQGMSHNTSLEFIDLNDDKPLSFKFSIREMGNVIKIQKLNGYEPVLMHVKQAYFVEHSDRITLKAVMTDGKEFEADFYQWQKI